MKKAIWWVVAIVIIVLIAVSVSNRGPKESGPLQVGMVTPLSGNVAALGEIMQKAAEFALEDVNAAGGIDGRPLEIIYEDDQCNAAKSVSSIQKLIDIDKVKVVIASSCSGPVLSMLPIAEKGKAFMLSAGATSPALSGKSPLFARTIASDSGEVEALAQYVVSQGWKKVAVLHESSDYALASYQSFVKAYGDKGTVVKEEYPDTTSDFRSILTKLKSTNPDALLLIPQSPTTGSRILTNLTQLKWRVPILASHVIAGGADVISQHKGVLEGAIAAEHEAATNDRSAALEKKYKDKYGKDVEYKAYFQAQYDAVRLLADGLTKFGNDPEKLAAWVRTVKDYDGVSGKLSINDQGDRVGGHTLKVIKNGKAEILK